jgi:hypothetical protein
VHSQRGASRRGEKPDIDPEQFQDPNEHDPSAGTTYKADDEEVDKKLR